MIKVGKDAVYNLVVCRTRCGVLTLFLVWHRGCLFGVAVSFDNSSTDINIRLSLRQVSAFRPDSSETVSVFILGIAQFEFGYIISLFTVSRADSTNQSIQKVLGGVSGSDVLLPPCG